MAWTVLPANMLCDGYARCACIFFLSMSAWPLFVAYALPDLHSQRLHDLQKRCRRTLLIHSLGE